MRWTAREGRWAMRLDELGELGLLEALAARGLAVRIDDDAAQLGDGLVVTQDALIEDVHFRRDWTSWRDLGFKAAAVNISDLSASAARPEALVVSLGLPRELEVEAVVELYEGLNEPGVPIVGGDTTRADRVYLSVTALGRSARVPGRGGARPGDVLVVTGPLGGSGAGYECLQRGISHPLVEAHRRPPLRVEDGLALGAVATAMLDLSDGLASDAWHIARRSACRLELELEQVPLPEGLQDLASWLGEDVWRLVCGFGEDYELLAAVPPGSTVPADCFPIGRCTEGEGVELRLWGEPRRLRGFDHFR